MKTWLREFLVLQVSIIGGSVIFTVVATILSQWLDRNLSMGVAFVPALAFILWNEHRYWKSRWSKGA